MTNQPSSAKKNSHDHHSPCYCAPHLHFVLLVWLEHHLELAILADGEHCAISVWISRAHSTTNQQMNLKMCLQTMQCDGIDFAYFGCTKAVACLV